jgi:hypothetical protein
MNNTIEKYLIRVEKNDRTDYAEFHEFINKLDFNVDSDFVMFLKNNNGASGFIGNNFISFWKLNELLILNPYYDYIDECNDFFFFATDGSNFGYAFEKKTGFVVGIDFLDISFEKPLYISDNFLNFLENLYSFPPTLENT